MAPPSQSQHPVVMPPLRLEIDDVGVLKPDKRWTLACRVVRMYQDQACNMSFAQQRNYIERTDLKNSFELPPKAENDARLHPMLSGYLQGYSHRSSALSLDEWLFLRALYEEYQLDEVSAAIPGVGKKPVEQASRYGEYRAFFPVAASPGLIELSPLYQLPMRAPPENPDDLNPADDGANSEKGKDVAGIAQTRDLTLEKRCHVPSTPSSARTPTIPDFSLLDASSFDGASSNATPTQEELNAQALEKISDNVGIFAKQIVTNGEVISYFVQRLQKVEKENEALKAHVRDLERKMASSSSSAGGSRRG